MTERWQEIFNGLRRLAREADYQSAQQRVASSRFDSAATFVAEQASCISRLQAKVAELEDQVERLGESLRRSGDGCDG